MSQSSADESYEQYKNVGILMSDMSGFTRSVRKMGIIHFASIIQKMRQLCSFVFKKHDALHIFFEADNCWILFPSAEKALEAATECAYVMADWNENYAKNEDWEINLSGMAVDFSEETVFVDDEGKFYGETVDRAFYLGEEVVEDGNVICSDLVYQMVNEASASTFEVLETDFEDDTLTYYRVLDDPHLDREGFVDVKDIVSDVAFTEENFNEHIRKLLSRFDTEGEELEVLNDTLKEEFLLYKTVVFVGHEFHVHTKIYGIEQTLHLFNQLADLLSPLSVQHGGVMEEQCLILFDDSKEAVRFMIEGRKAVVAYNQDKDEKHKLPLTGFGAHLSDLLYIPTTDIHWGDAVNTGSKLGEDIAENQEILISNTLYEQVKDVIEEYEITPEERSYRVSGVDLPSYSF
eukprot:TRINITY_DN11541_c0_g1_i1.p1 TRINITY_DN11541_c0_g1~~TRINITY_DN11541_c0_g1_i1.p1  ORF type:complete len:405 (+),score=95.56 TRINITY_DN11541_c0_g1_i1:40-1254(+)